MSRVGNIFLEQLWVQHISVWNFITHLLHLRTQQNRAFNSSIKLHKTVVVTELRRLRVGIIASICMTVVVLFYLSTSERRLAICSWID